MNNLVGIVLCGGHSSRMGSDKSMIPFHGVPQYMHAAGLLSNFCESVYLSCNNQNANTFDKAYSLIIDHANYTQAGPMGGLLSCFETLGQKNLFVLGCDYPFIEKSDLQTLQMQFLNNQNCIAYYSNQHEVYEPTIAIYPYSTFTVMKQAYEVGNHSLQRLLKNIPAEKKSMENAAKFSSIDTPIMRDEAIKKIKS